MSCRERRTPQAPSTGGLIAAMKSLPDQFVMKHNSLDGYLFLRYFKLLILISLAGCLVTWPVLFPVNATGKGGQSQLDILTFSNVVNANRYYAHAGIAWIFLGGVMLAIFYERLHFIGVRQAYYLSPLRAKRLTSRVVLFMGIPKEYQSEEQLATYLGATVRKIWMVNDCKKLEKEVQARDKAALKMENAETKLIINNNKSLLKNKGEKPTSVKQMIESQKRPQHRLKPIIGKKVMTIDWCREEIPKMTAKIQEEQQRKLAGADVVSAAFVEFDSQESAQKAFQLAAPSKKKSFQPRFVDVQPEEIIWKNLSRSWATRKALFTAAGVAMVFITLFWTPITAFVGALANINYLTNKVHFLSFINSIPKPILGVVTGLLPVIVLAVCVMLVPIICRQLAKLAGAATLSEVELKTQSWYFIFQVIQVFLITTFASGAAAVTTQIINSPGQAPQLLANNLPKASNFYISYFILFGLLQSALQLLSIAPLLFKTILAGILDKTPRKRYVRFTTLAGLGWGSEYPKWTNLGVIALSYSCIAPVILGFSAVGFILLYLAFRHNWLFVFGNKIDMKGAAYEKALRQLTTGVYLSALCLTGLFAIKVANNRAALGPLVLMLIFIGVIIVAQTLFDAAVKPLMEHLPVNLVEQHDTAPEPKNIEDGYANGVNGQQHPALRDGDHLHPGEKDVRNHSATTDTTLNQNSGNTELPNAKEKKESFLTKKLRPIVHNRFFLPLHNAPSAVKESRTKLHGTGLDVAHLWDEDNAYANPALSSQGPLIWLPRDTHGVSRELVSGNNQAGLESTDEYAWLNDKSKVEWDVAHHEQVEMMLHKWKKESGQNNDFATAGGNTAGQTL